MGYHPCSIGFLTSRREPAVGQCQAGSLTGAVASERVSEAPKGSLRMVGNHSKSAKAEGSLTATPTGGAGTKVGLSDPVVLSGNAIAQRIKATLGITGLSLPKSSHRRSGLAPRCRLIASWGCSRPKGWAVRPLKRYASWVQNVVRTVRSLSGVGVGYLRGAALSTRRTRGGRALVYRLFCQEHGRVAKSGRDKR